MMRAPAMQQSVRPIPHNRHSFSALARTAGAASAALLAVFTLLALPGCDPAAPTNTGEAKPHEGVALTVRCPDPALAGVVEPAARVWAARAGATVTVRRDAAGDADVEIVPAVSVGELAE